MYPEIALTVSITPCCMNYNKERFHRNPSNSRNPSHSQNPTHIVFSCRNVYRFFRSIFMVCCSFPQYMPYSKKQYPGKKMVARWKQSLLSGFFMTSCLFEAFKSSIILPVMPLSTHIKSRMCLTDTLGYSLCSRSIPWLCSVYSPCEPRL